MSKSLIRSVYRVGVLCNKNILCRGVHDQGDRAHPERPMNISEDRGKI